MRKILSSALLKTVCDSFRPASSVPLRTPAFLRTRRSFAQVRSNREFFPDIWFTSSTPSCHAPGDYGPSSAPNKPDKRTLKLGKSKGIHLFYKRTDQSLEGLLMYTFSYSSPENPSESPAHASCFTSSSRNPLSSYISPPLSLYTPTSPYCFRPSWLPCRALDSSDGLGPRTNCWQCQAHHYQRAGCEGWPLHLQRPRTNWRRAAHCTVEDVWED